MEDLENSFQWSDYQVKKSYNFFKFIWESKKAGYKLDLPPKFAEEFGDELSEVATLTVPTGDVWLVRLRRIDEKISFVDGWKDFSKHYSIIDGQFIVFCYQGSSKFSVTIYDFSACEIEYPFRAENITDDDCTTFPSPHASVKGKGKEKCVEQHVQKKRGSTSMDSSDAKKLKRASIEENRQPTRKDYKKVFLRNIRCYTCPRIQLMIPKVKQKVVHATKMFKLENPFYAVILQPNNIYNKFVYVPSAFARKYLPERPRFIKLQCSDGKEWDAHYLTCETNYRIGSGFVKIFRHNSLKVGDVCLFELINRKDVVLKVSVLHDDEYSAMTNQKGKRENGVRLNENVAPHSPEVPVKHEENAEILACGTMYHSQKVDMAALSRETKRAIDAARASNIDNKPSFMVILRPFMDSKYCVDVPAAFVKNHLLGCTDQENIYLKASNGEKYPVHCIHGKGGRYYLKLRGFSAFRKHNDLEEGDVCVFKMIESNSIVLEVSVFHAIDYAK